MGGKKIARIGGIDILVNWTTLFLITLLMVELATVAYPAVAGKRDLLWYWIAAAVTVILFFASLLGHEMAHSLVARRQGARVTTITLWLLGGVSSIPDDPAGPSQELRRAVVGPLTSIVLGVIFLAAAVVIGAVGMSGLTFAAVMWLGYINIVLGIFNLLPAFPLDGGRVLRAILWRHRNDELSATITSGRVGNVFGYILIWAGVAEFLLMSEASGVWLALVGGFLIMASRAEVAAIVGRSTLASLTASDVMMQDIAAVPDWITLTALVKEYMLPQHRSIYRVRDFSGIVSGLITIEDVRKINPLYRGSTQVRSASMPMRDLVQVKPTDRAVDLQDKLSANPRHLAVVMQGDDALGVITPSDIEFAESAVALTTPPARR